MIYCFSMGKFLCYFFCFPIDNDFIMWYTNMNEEKTRKDRCQFENYNKRCFFG